MWLVGEGWKAVKSKRWAGGKSHRASHAGYHDGLGFIDLQKEVPGGLQAWRLYMLIFTLS